MPIENGAVENINTHRENLMITKTMKYFLTLVLTCISGLAISQKYVLLDPAITLPVTYSDKVTSTDKFNGLIPVENRSVRQFISALEEIVQQLSKEGPSIILKDYKVGCCAFKGIKIKQGKETRVDYVITSICDNLTISMHLSDAKIKNSTNAYFITTWIKYIKSGLKK